MIPLTRSCVLIFAFISVANVYGMTALDDRQLSNVTGQALLQMGKDESNGFTFYKAGLDAEVEINLNIEKLQLGCGGVNGAAGCDIDIDNLSLSGPEGCGANRPDCSAVLTRPYFEFAIKNDDSRTLREVSGIRLSAENAFGLLTAGQNDGTANGINTLSGYLQVAPTTGSTSTQAAFFGDQLQGLITTGSCGGGFGRNISCAGFQTNGGGINIGSQDVTFNVPGFTVNDSRMTNLSVEGITSQIPSIPINYEDGSLVAQLVSLSATDGTSYNSCLYLIVCGITLQNVRLQSSLDNLGVEISLDQDLGLIHKIPVNNPFSLSFQKEAVDWPGGNAGDVAQRGWWLSFADPVQLGDLSTPAGFELDISDAFPQVATFVSNYLRTRANAAYAPFGDAVGGVFTGNLDLALPPIDLSGNTAALDLVNLPLGAAQDVTANCYGSASFC